MTEGLSSKELLNGRVDKLHETKLPKTFNFRARWFVAGVLDTTRDITREIIDAMMFSGALVFACFQGQASKLKHQD